MRIVVVALAGRRIASCLLSDIEVVRSMWGISEEHKATASNQIYEAIIVSPGTSDSPASVPTTRICNSRFVLWRSSSLLGSFGRQEVCSSQKQLAYFFVADL
jgi:hypothetical protein